MPRLLAALREESVEDGQRPLYARALRLKHVEPGKVLCAVFFEGSIVVAMLLAFADLVSWWGVLATPATAAAMVKLNDVVVGKLPDPHAARRPRMRPDVPTFDDAVVAGYGGPVEAPRAPGRPEARSARGRSEAAPVPGRSETAPGLGRSEAAPVPGRSEAAPVPERDEALLAPDGTEAPPRAERVEAPSVSEPDTEVLGVLADDATVLLPPVSAPDTDATVPLRPLPEDDPER